MDIANNPVETKSLEGEEDKKKSQSSDGAACAEDKQGLPTDAGEDVVAAPIANPEKAKKPPRVKKVVMERTVSTPRTIDIDSDPLFFAKLNLVSKRIEQDARRHRLSALPIV